MAAPKAREDLALTVSDIKTENKWFLTNLILKNNGSSNRMLPVYMDSGVGLLWLGRLFGWSRDGKRIPLRVGTTQKFSYDYPYLWSLVNISQGGNATFGIRFRPESFFSDSPLARITCDVLGDQGLETFVIADSFDDALFQKPPSFGPESGGVKCRIRTARANYKRGDEIRLFLEVVNTKQQPLAQISKGGWTVEIDGKKVDGLSQVKSTGAWGGQWGPFYTQEYYIEVDSSEFSIGEHTVRIFCRGKGRSFWNTTRKALPVFKGKLESNSWTFMLEEKQ